MQNVTLQLAKLIYSVHMLQREVTTTEVCTQDSNLKFLKRGNPFLLYKISNLKTKFVFKEEG